MTTELAQELKQDLKQQLSQELNQEQQDTIRNWQDSFLGKALATHTREYFHDHPALKGIPENAKQNLIDDFYQKIFELTQSEEPLLTLRGYIASFVHSYAVFQILSLNSNDKTNAFFHNNPHISGNLHNYIRSLAVHNAEINDLATEDKMFSDKDLIDFCRTKTAISLFYMNGMNIVRCQLNDRNQESDWLRPFIESTLILEEESCRKNIGLPSLLENTNDMQRHSMFIQFVSGGSQDPYSEWKNYDIDSATLPTDHSIQ